MNVPRIGLTGGRLGYRGFLNQRNAVARASG